MFSQPSTSYLIKNSDLALSTKLGQGGFGEVYRGTYLHNDVAVKKLLMDNISNEAAAEFQQEAQTMAQLRSPNIVQFYGFCMSPHYCIVMEYMPNGSLFSVLRSNQPLDWPTRFGIAVDIAKGVSYLHHNNILHRDIKSLNVLLDKNYQAKLTDFGLSKVKSETKSHSMATKTKSDSVGTVAWMAPELFERKAVFTQKSDIYSLAMTFWELAARQIPFSDAASQDLIPMWVQRGDREDIPKNCPPELSQLIVACWQAVSNNRPDANTVVERLKAAQQKWGGNHNNNQSHNNNNTVSEGSANTSAVHSSPNSGPQYQGNFNSSLPAKAPAQKTKFQEQLDLAQQGNASAQSYVGYCYEAGQDGALQNKQQALFWYQQAANQQNAYAMEALKRLQPANPVAFSDVGKVAVKADAPKPNVSVAPELVKQFLKHVVEGEQEKAEAMLKKNKALALASNDVTDLSGRTFQGITGFQYAVWALDRHMWSMIEKYLEKEVGKVQLVGMENGSWISKHGKSADATTLVKALDKQVELLKASKWDEGAHQWQVEVGGAQRQLPAHVVNTYCHPNRSFERCPDFGGETELPRTRQTDAGDWFTASYNGGRLGEKFAVCRGPWDVAKPGFHGRDRLGDGAAHWLYHQDRTACHALFETRTRERDALLAKYQAGNVLRK